MKRIILQIVAITLTMLTLFTTYSNAFNVQYEDPLTTDVAGNNIGNQVQQWGEEGTADTTSNSGTTNSHELSFLQIIIDTIVAVLGSIIAIIPLIINTILSLVVTQGQGTFTIQDLLLGKYNLFNINLFNADNITGPYADTIKSISNSVSLWYIAIRNLAIIGVAIILVYIGIRMAISSVAEDKAKYKIMLKSWFIGLILLFFLHYIVVILINMSEWLVEFASKSMQKGTIAEGMETEIISNSFKNIWESSGLDKVFYIIIYFMMVYYQLKFFIMYIMRVFKISFLIMISPLICVTYPIDIIGDNKAQAFNNWIKQLVMEIFIQPIHLFIYIVFVYSAGEIAKLAPLVALMFFTALSNGEKIVRRAFKVSGKGLKDIKMKPPKLG